MSDIWYSIKEDWPVVLVGAVVVLFIGFLIALAIQPQQPYDISGYLVGKEYTPSKTETGVGSGVSSDGKPIVVVTSNSQSEKWTVVLSVDGKYKSYEVSPDVFYSLPEKQNVTLRCRRGEWIQSVNCK